MFLIATNKYEFDISVTKSKEGGDHGNKKNNVQNNVKHGKPKFSAGTENMPKMATPKTRVLCPIWTFPLMNGTFEMYFGLREEWCWLN